METKHIIKKMDSIVRIGVIGSSGVGKTSLVQRFVYGTFSEKRTETFATETTIKSDHIYKTPLDIKSIKFYINDHIGTNYIETQLDELKNYDGYILVYSKDDKNSFENAVKMIPVLFNIKNWKINRNQLDVAKNYYPIILVENKNDLNLVADFAINSICKTYNIKKYITSAKTGECVDDVFRMLGRIIYTEKNKIIEKSPSVISQFFKQSIKTEIEEDIKNKPIRIFNFIINNDDQNILQKDKSNKKECIIS